METRIDGYLYYNQQRFLNFTRNAIEGIHEQLDRTSLMTWQNRLLAEKGGVCAMFGDACCTYIPNNTAPDGSITRALASLTSLSNELATNSGISDPWDRWFMSTFGSWGQRLKSVFISLAVVFIVLLLIGCCIVPLIHYIISKYFTASIAKAYMLHEEHMLQIASSVSSSLSPSPPPSPSLTSTF
ncbi:SYNA protein, partial [Polypterus senegalus]